MVGQGHRPVEGHPAHQLGVQEVAGLAPDLPDPLVLFLPTPGGGVGQLDEEPSGGWCQIGWRTPLVRGGHRPDPSGGVVEEVVREAVHGAEQFAVDVELALVPGAVADPNGGGVSPALQVRQLPLGQVPFATDAEHDLQVAAPVERAGRRGGHVVEELIGLVGAGRHPEGLDREGGVPDPGVAVVPVSGAAHHLGQRRGRRRADGAGGCEGECLEHPSAVVHQVAPRTHVGLVELRPRLPRRHGVFEPCARSRTGSRPGPSPSRPAWLWCRAKPALSPRRSWSWPETADWSTVRATGEERTSTSAPPNAVTPPSTASSRGWTSPYSGRGTYSRDNSTSPSTHVARRSRRCGASLPSSCPRLPSPMARASVMVTVPVGVRKVVSSTMVRSR